MMVQNLDLEAHKKAIADLDFFISDLSHVKDLKKQDELLEAEAQYRATQKHLELLVNAIVLPHYHDQVNQFIFNIFDSDWFATNYHKNHPLTYCLRITMPRALECIIQTLFFILIQLGDEWLKKDDLYFTELRRVGGFTQMLFELEMVALLKASGFEIDPQHKTGNGKKIDAHIRLDGWQAYCECKKLGESDIYKNELKGGLFQLMTKSGIKGKLDFKEYPSIDDLDKIQSIITSKKTGKHEDDHFILSLEPHEGDVFQGSGIHTISFGEADDKRIKNTLLNAYKQYIDDGFPFIILAQVSDSAGITNAINKAKTLIANDKRISKFDEILIVRKIKKFGFSILTAPAFAPRVDGTSPGYSYAIYPIKNIKSKDLLLLEFEKGQFVLK